MTPSKGFPSEVTEKFKENKLLTAIANVSEKETMVRRTGHRNTLWIRIVRKLYTRLHIQAYPVPRMAEGTLSEPESAANCRAFRLNFTVPGMERMNFLSLATDHSRQTKFFSVSVRSLQGWQKYR
ncbi:MAG: hypothetical protein ACOY5B_10475 [Spirochaetota bacterium]